MSVPSPVAGVVLAAGRSLRAGPRNKLLARVEGEPMVRRVVGTALASELDPVVVVVAREEDAVTGALEGLDVVVVPNPHAGDGLSTSLRRGIEGVPTDREAAVVLLGDMPWVRPATVRALVAAFRDGQPASPCLPVHDGRRGNPVLWPRRFFSRLTAVDGDVGARGLLQELHDRVREVAVPDDGILRDVDTPEELAALSEPPNPNQRKSPCPS